MKIRENGKFFKVPNFFHILILIFLFKKIIPSFCRINKSLNFGQANETIEAHHRLRRPQSNLPQIVQRKAAGKVEISLRLNFFKNNTANAKKIIYLQISLLEHFSNNVSLFFERPAPTNPAPNNLKFVKCKKFLRIAEIINKKKPVLEQTKMSNK